MPQFEEPRQFVTKAEQQWGSAKLGGFTVEECPLMQAEDTPYSGLFRLPTGFQFPHHAHGRWVQILVLGCKIRVEIDGWGIDIAYSGSSPTCQ